MDDLLIRGYKQFLERYAHGDDSLMAKLAQSGQQPKHMIIACSDSRVDPALLVQADPGQLFVVRNVANIVPPYELDGKHHGTSAALEFGMCYLNIQHLIILGHSQCGGIQAATGVQSLHQDDFISGWMNDLHIVTGQSVNEAAKQGLLQSYQNCLTFPWIKERKSNNILTIDLWYFDIEMTQVQQYDHSRQEFKDILASDS